MTAGQFSTVIIISSLISSSLALDVCKDTDTINCQSCGNTDYPRDELYRDNCMKSCGVCKGTNIALGKPTSQSSTFQTSSSNKAVDGNTDNHWENGYCTHTYNNFGSNWWCVDLQQTYNIYNITLFNRDIYKDRLRGFEIKIGSNDQCNQAGFTSATSCYKDTSTVQDVYTIDRCNQPTPTSISARAVYVTVPSKPLTLCEVQMFSDLGQCNTGYYNTSSSTCQPCNTCLGDTCYPSNGVCTGDCKTGFYGTKCQQNCSNGCLNNQCYKSDGRCNDCKPDTVGQYCNLTCGAECQPITDQNATTCDRNGICTSCIDGKTGDRCINSCNTNCTVCDQDDANSCTECKDGRWGSSCSKLCNTYCKPVAGKTVGKCDQMTGNCINGCVPGKTGPNCTTDCAEGLYGDNCASKCGNCFDETPCNIITGSCEPVGCADGFQGLKCIDKQTDNYTAIIAAVVSTVVVVVIATVVVVLVLRRRRRQKSTDSDQVEVKDIALNANPGVSGAPEKTVKVEEKPTVSGNTYVNLLRPSDQLEVDEQAAQVYVNVDEPTESSTRVKLINLLQYIKSRRKTLKSEYESLPSGLCSAYDYCMNAVNKPKNRYKNICAFDHSRVKLDIENDDPNSDYINACYITGYSDAERKYIASQGPIDVMIKEFLRLLWISQTGKIVMLTNLVEMGKEKCFQYWPESGEQMKFGNISVTLVNEDNFSHFTIRTLKLTKDDCGSRTIKQYHYTSWPDKGVPTDISSLVEFRSKVIKSVSPHPGPMLIHCSAGIGRTGTFIGLDYLIEEARAVESLDVYECVKQMRYERVNMVQTWEQYVFLHDALAVWYTAEDITFPVASYQQGYQTLLKVNKTSGKSQLQERFEMLNDVCPPQSTADCSVALLDENQNKNRDLSILASDKVRLCLSKPNTTDYINAVFLSSYKKKRAYILTQTPLSNTVIDFWTMVVEQDVTTIVNMDITETGNDIGQYIPAADELNCGPYNIIKQDKTTHENGIYSVVTCLINSELDENLQRRIKIYQCNFWNPTKRAPKSAGPIFTLLDDIKTWSQQHEDGPIIVHCRNGVEKSGVFCVLAAILERLTIEQDVSILQTLVQLRVSRPQIMASIEQLKFCFDAVGEYLDEFAVYANSC